MFSYNAYVTPLTSIAPARPANAPLTRSTLVVVLATSMRPAIRAASELAPIARTRNPAAVDRIAHQRMTAAATPNANPQCSRVPGIRKGRCIRGGIGLLWGYA